MVKFKIKDTYYRLIDGYDIQESSREVKFSNVILDFTNKTILDLPLKYQECQLVDINGNSEEIIYTGYVNNFNLPKMKNKKEYRELELELLSPLAMATVRTADAVGTYNLQLLINELIMPLINDGFVLKEMNVGNNQITVNFLNETVESSLNKLSNKYNFWWYIDKNKNIYINSIEYLISKTPKLVYDNNNKIDGLIDVIPSINATDYCNVVNFSNVRLFTYSRIDRRTAIDTETSQEYVYYTDYNPIMSQKEINPGDEIEFDIPFDISLSNYLKVKDTFRIGTISPDIIFSINYYDENNIGVNNNEYISFQNNEINISSNISINDTYSDSNKFVLVRDSFFNNLIVGLKYNGSQKIIINSLQVANALMWTKIKIIDNNEVYKNKGIISETGIVEKQIDMKEQWKFHDEIIDIANSYIKKNTSKVEQVKLNIDQDNNLNIGDTIKINKPFFLIDDTYIITDKNIIYDDNVKTWQFILKNKNILESYIDLFRASEQEEIEKNYHLITSNYSEETIKETYEVVEI